MMSHDDLKQGGGRRNHNNHQGKEASSNAGAISCGTVSLGFFFGPLKPWPSIVGPRSVGAAVDNGLLVVVVVVGDKVLGAGGRVGETVGATIAGRSAIPTKSPASSNIVVAGVGEGTMLLLLDPSSKDEVVAPASPCLIIIEDEASPSCAKSATATPIKAAMDRSAQVSRRQSILGLFVLDSDGVAKPIGC